MVTRNVIEMEMTIDEFWDKFKKIYVHLHLEDQDVKKVKLIMEKEIHVDRINEFRHLAFYNWRKEVVLINVDECIVNKVARDLGEDK